MGRCLYGVLLKLRSGDANPYPKADESTAFRALLGGKRLGAGDAVGDGADNDATCGNHTQQMLAL